MQDDQVAEDQYGETLARDLPDGENIVWQGAPELWPLVRRAFYFNHIALYLVVLTGMHTGYLIWGGDPLSHWSGMLAWQAGVSFLVLALIYGLARLYQKSTAYTLTDERLCIQTGAAIPVFLNIPVAKIVSADIHKYGDHTADISLCVAPEEKIHWLLLWPSVRSWWIRPPQPLLRGLADAEVAARALARVALTHGDVHAGAFARANTEENTESDLAPVN